MFLETTLSDYQKPAKTFLKTANPDIRLTSRDLSIIEFLLEMKFSGLEQLCEKFFPQSELGLRGYSFWTRDRLAKLRSHGLIETFQFPGSMRKFFLASEKGRKRSIGPILQFPKLLR